MTRAVISIVLSAAFAVAGGMLAPAASAAGGDLAGTWTSVDGDGSNQTLDINGAGRHAYSMVYVDDAATSACGGDPAMISGPGVVDGDLLQMSGALVCLPGGNLLRTRLDIGFLYDAGSDTLTDDFGIVWHRA